MVSWLANLLTVLASCKVAADVCTSAVWNEAVTSGSWEDTDSWFESATPSKSEIAYIISDQPTVVTIDTGIVEARAIIIDGSDGTFIDIGGEDSYSNWLVIGSVEDTTPPPCYATIECSINELEVPSGYHSTPVGSGIQYDTELEAVVFTEM
jgi:hypothetical protein